MTDTTLEGVQDPRADGDICGITRHHGATEFICIREPHLNIYRVKKRSGYTGDRVITDQEQSPPRHGETVQGDRHYFVSRWVRNDPEMVHHYDVPVDS